MQFLYHILYLNDFNFILKQTDTETCRNVECLTKNFRQK